MNMLSRRLKADPENTAPDVAAARACLALPPKPAPLRLAEASYREAREHFRNVTAKLNFAHAQVRADGRDTSPEVERKTAELAAAKQAVQQTFAARELERKNWQPAFNATVGGPIEAALEVLRAETERLDVVAQGILEVHTYATASGIESPVGRAPTIVEAIRSCALQWGIEVCGP